MCEDKIFIPSIIQSYVLRCYHTYLLQKEMDRMEATIIQKFHWCPLIVNFFYLIEKVGEVFHNDDLAGHLRKVDPNESGGLDRFQKTGGAIGEKLGSDQGAINFWPFMINKNY